jgi:hypothetical protein
MDESSITVVVLINLSCALTALSMSHITSLSEIWLGHFVTIIAFAFSLNSHMQKETEHDDRHTSRF